MDPNTLRLMQGSAGAGAKVYVEDVFSTWLYTGNGSTQTITNGIDLAGKGGLVWMKSRSTTGNNYTVFNDSGTLKDLYTNGTTGAGTATWTSWNNNGFSLSGVTNGNGDTYASWTFRKQAKFFDVVTYTGNGTAGRQIAHSLGGTPGCVIIKCTSNAGPWPVWHTGISTHYGKLNVTDAFESGVTAARRFGDGSNVIAPTSSVFTVGADSDVNENGYTYVAYLFAHDAGGFGDSGNESVISCGSYTGNGSATGPTVTLGWEPQWLLVKRTDSAGYSWFMHDNMRQMSLTNTAYVTAESSSAESLWGSALFNLSATGFQLNTSNPSFNGSGGTYIYIAIRRGPMKTPTDATKVFSANTYTGTSPTAQTVTTGFPIDLIINGLRTQSHSTDVVDRMRGRGAYLYTSSTSSELTSTSTQDLTNLDIQDGYKMGTLTNSDFNKNGENLVSWSFRRAPGFFDVVAYTNPSGNAGSETHNLGVKPQMIIVKNRLEGGAWEVYHEALGATNYLRLSTTAASASASTIWNNTEPTSTVFTHGNNGSVASATGAFIVYLFASCPGVSKVGSYTGTGTTQQINCGFTNGSRFVLIKRTDSTGDWYVWDSARGIVAGNDPYLLLNSSAAEVTNTDYIDTYSAGFEISSTAPAAINANGGSFIFLAVA